MAPGVRTRRFRHRGTGRTHPLPLPAWERGEVKPALKQVGHFANSLHVPLGYRAELERLRANSKGSGGNFYWPQGARVG